MKFFFIYFRVFVLLLVCSVIRIVLVLLVE